MGKRVYILGAGASVDAGGPLMSNWPKRLCEMDASVVPENHWGNEFTSREIIEMIQTYINNNLVRENNWDIEELLTYTYTLELIGQPININPPDGSLVPIPPSLFRRGMIWLMKKSLEISLEKPIPDMYLLFASSLQADNNAIINLNYDLVIEDALQQTKKPYFYALDTYKDHTGLTNSSEARIPLLKLHGSMNWQMCMGESRGVPPKENIADCRIIHTYETKQISHDPFEDDPCPACGRNMFETLIVPPIIGKFEHVRVLKSVWNIAAADLFLADEVVAIGYSMPEADQMIKFLLRATSREASQPRLVVVNKNQSAATSYQSLPYRNKQILTIPFETYLSNYI